MTTDAVATIFEAILNAVPSEHFLRYGVCFAEALHYTILGGLFKNPDVFNLPQNHNLQSVEKSIKPLVLCPPTRAFLVRRQYYGDFFAILVAVPQFTNALLQSISNLVRWNSVLFIA